LPAIDRLTTERLRFAVQQVADEKFQVNGFLRISVSDGFKQFADGYFHASSSRISRTSIA